MAFQSICKIVSIHTYIDIYVAKVSLLLIYNTYSKCMYALHIALLQIFIVKYSSNFKQRYRSIKYRTWLFNIMNHIYLKFVITYSYNMIFMLSTYVCTFLNTVTLHQQCCQPVFPIWLLPIPWNVCSSILQHQIHSISLDSYCFYYLLFPAQVSNPCKCTYIHNLLLLYILK